MTQIHDLTLGFQLPHETITGFPLQAVNRIEIYGVPIEPVSTVRLSAGNV